MSYKKLKAKYQNVCKTCSTKINVGETIYWHPETKIIVHKKCFEKRKKLRPEGASRRTSLTYPFSGSYRNGRRK